MINVYLDDLRDIPQGFVGARTFEEAQNLLLNNKVNVLSLDHDLGCNETGIELKNGYDLVKWICEYYFEYDLCIENIYLHTDNNVGRENMLETLKACQRRGFIDNNINIYHYPIVPNKYSGL